MARYLIDANLPYRFALWHGEDYQHVFDFDDTWSDLQIWDHARREDMVIVTKDADFSALAMLHQPPPRVVHLKIGNLRMSDFHALLQRLWPEVQAMSQTHRLLTVYPDRIEGVR